MALNTTAQAIQDAENQAAASLAATIEAAVLAELPFLQFPVFNFFFKRAVFAAVDALVKQSDNLVYSVLTTLEIAKQRDAFARAEASGDQAAIEAAANALIHIGGTA